MKIPPIHITPHDLDLSSALRDFIHRKISSLSRFAGDIVAAEVVLRGRSGAAHLFSVGARLALPGKDIQGHAVHANLYTAIDWLAARLARLARKRKTRRANLFRRRARSGSRARRRLLSFSSLEIQHFDHDGKLLSRRPPVRQRREIRSIGKAYRSDQLSVLVATVGGR